MFPHAPHVHILPPSSSICDLIIHFSVPCLLLCLGFCCAVVKTSLIAQITPLFPTCLSSGHIFYKKPS